MNVRPDEKSQIFDSIIDEMGDVKGFEQWGPAHSQSVTVNFDNIEGNHNNSNAISLGSISISGRPDAVWNGIPVELKTVKSSFAHALTSSKVAEWIKQVAVYQKTHSQNIDSNEPGNAILVVVSLQDREIMAVEVNPVNVGIVEKQWKDIVFQVCDEKYFDEAYFGKYWNSLRDHVNQKDEDYAGAKANRKVLIAQARNWLEVDSNNLLNSALSLVKDGDLQYVMSKPSSFLNPIGRAKSLAERGRSRYVLEHDRSYRTWRQGFKRDFLPIHDSCLRLSEEKMGEENYVDSIIALRLAKGILSLCEGSKSKIGEIDVMIENAKLLGSGVAIMGEQWEEELEEENGEEIEIDDEEDIVWGQEVGEIAA